MYHVLQVSDFYQNYFHDFVLKVHYPIGHLALYEIVTLY